MYWVNGTDGILRSSTLSGDDEKTVLNINSTTYEFINIDMFRDAVYILYYTNLKYVHVFLLINTSMLDTESISYRLLFCVYSDLIKQKNFSFIDFVANALTINYKSTMFLNSDMELAVV